MNINYKAENKENKQLNLEKRNKQNSGIPKPVLYTSLSIAGVAAISIIGKILYDKSKKNDDNNPGSQQNNQYKNNEINITNNKKIKQTNEWKNLVYDHDIKINGIKLTPADQKWFRTYMILFQQQYPLCWHNASMQFLACPEIRFGEEEYKQEFKEEYPQKIKSMINWINSQIEIKRKDKNLKIEDYFNEKIRIHVPPAVREAQDGKEGRLPPKNHDPENKEPLFGLGNGNDFMFYYQDNKIYDKFNGIDFTKNIINCSSLLGCSINSHIDKLEDINIGCESEDMMNNFHIKNKDKGFTLSCIRAHFLHFPIINLLFHFVNNNGVQYLPTFLAIGNQGHYSVFYILYNSDMSLKYAILGDGGQPGFKILNYDDFNKKLESLKSNDQDGLMIRYSPQNIVKKYYTPELMFNN